MENANQDIMKAQPGVTPLTTLRSYSEGKIIELPQFSEGQTFFAKVRRPSILKMAESGIIPNTLLNIIAKLFSTGETVDQDDPNSITEMFKLTRIMAKACLVEPTYDDLESAGIELTDEQLSYLFHYAQSGVETLSSFRVDGEA